MKPIEVLEIRRIAKISQKEFAKIANVGLATLQRYEQGKNFTNSTAQKIIQVALNLKK